MAKKLYILLIVLVLGNAGYSQFVGKDPLSVALFYMQKTELDSAKKYMDIAVQDAELNSQAKTWYYSGFLYKDLYKAKQKDERGKTHKTRK